MIEKVKDELDLLKGGIKIFLKLVLYFISFIIFLSIMSFLWVLNTTELQRENNESIENIITIGISLILTGFVIGYFESKVKTKKD